MEQKNWILSRKLILERKGPESVKQSTPWPDLKKIVQRSRLVKKKIILIADICYFKNETTVMLLEFITSFHVKESEF